MKTIILSLFFRAGDVINFSGDQLWKSDGTETGNMLLKDPNLSTFYSESYDFTYLNNNMYFVSTNYTIGRELFRTDGTVNGTVGYNIRYLTESSTPEKLTVVNNTLFFTADNGGDNGRELWALATQALPVEDSDFSKLNISIYPNPTKDIINIKNPSNLPIHSIIITDLTGKKILEQNNVSSTIDVSKLQMGLFIIQLRSNEKTVVKKFIKN